MRPKPEGTIAKEVEIKEEDDDKVHFLSVKNGQFVNRESTSGKRQNMSRRRKTTRITWTKSSIGSLILVMNLLRPIANKGRGELIN